MIAVTVLTVMAISYNHSYTLTYKDITCEGYTLVYLRPSPGEAN